MRYCILLLIVLTSCVQERTYSVPPELDPYVREFFIQGKLNPNDYDIVVIYEEDVIKNKHAFGYTRHNGRHMTVSIDQGYCGRVLKSYPDRMYALIFHELGHGVLQRDHIEGYSLMNPDYLQTAEWRPFVHEMFNAN